MEYHVIRPLDLRTPFLLLPACTEELLSTPYIMTFLPNPSPLDTEKNPRASNTITYLEQEYLSESGFLVHLTEPNKKFPNVTLMSRLSGNLYFITKIYYSLMISSFFFLL